MSKRQQCTSCGGYEFVAAIDNHGQPYQGCSRCVIAWPPAVSADDELVVAREVVARSGRDRLNSHANAVHTCDVLARAVLSQHDEIAQLRSCFTEARQEADGALSEMGELRLAYQRLLARCDLTERVLVAAKAWAKYGRDDADDENDLLNAVYAVIELEKREFEEGRG